MWRGSHLSALSVRTLPNTDVTRVTLEGEPMHGIHPAAVDVSGGNLVMVIVVAVIALVALGLAAMFRSEVLAAGEGTDNMKRIDLPVQEGAKREEERRLGKEWGSSG